MLSPTIWEPEVLLELLGGQLAPSEVIQQFAGRDAQAVREPEDRLEAWLPLVALQAADRGGVDACPAGEVFLGEAALLAKLAEALPERHAHHQMAMRSRVSSMYRSPADALKRAPWRSSSPRRSRCAKDPRTALGSMSRQLRSTSARRHHSERSLRRSCNTMMRPWRARHRETAWICPAWEGPTFSVQRSRRQLWL